MKRLPASATLESQVKAVLDAYVTGVIECDAPMTATRIASFVNERFNGARATPATVNTVLVRFEAIGFITFGNARPLTFGSYTDAAREIGLTQLKIRHRNEAKRTRKEARTKT